jgi:D-alanyl-D-alanine dipeptidase
MTAAEPIVLISDPAIAAVEVRDNCERLIALPERGRLITDARLADPDGHFRLVRAGVAERLVRAAEGLPTGVMLALVEGYRPTRLQARYFRDYRTSLSALTPGADAETLDDLAARAVAPPGPAAPHLSGGAVDVTLYGDDGRELDMGSALNATPEECAGACYTGADGLSDRVRRHRALLAGALGSCGFVNYPTEWWHWSFGDRYWAMRTGAPFAVYGATEPT